MLRPLFTHTYSRLLPLLIVVGLLVPGVVWAEGITDTIYELVLGFFGYFAGWSALLLNWSVNQFVIDFATNINDTGIGAAINALWVVVRDLFNIGFIFGLVYIGFKMIWDSDNSNTRRTLVTLIAAALLINFSLLVSKFVVDFSNIIATEVAQSAFPAGTNNGEVSIGDGFFSYMQLPTTANPSTGLLQGDTTSWGYIFGIALVYIVAIFAFCAGAIMLTIRYAALCIFMILSPFMFAGWVFPQLQSYTRKYWTKFIGNAFYAPAYLIMLYFSGAVIQASFAPNSSGGIGQHFSTGNTIVDSTSSFGAGIGPFILSAVFLIMSVQIAGKLSMDGAERATGMAKGARRFYMRNTTGWIARGAGSVAERTERGWNRRVSSNLQQSDNRFVRGLGRLSDRTVGSGLRSASNASIAGSETARQRRERIATQQTAANNTTQERARESAGEYGRLSNERIIQMARQNRRLLNDDAFLSQLTAGQVTALRNSGMLTQSQGRDLASNRSRATVNRVNEAFTRTGASADELNDAFNEMARTIRTMSAEDKAGLGVTELQRAEVAAHLTDDDLRQLESNGVSTTDIATIRTARTNAQVSLANGTTSVRTTNTTERDAFFDERRQAMMRNARQAGTLPVEVFQQPDIIPYITPAALTERIRNGVTDDDIRAIKAAIASTPGLPTSFNTQISAWIARGTPEAVRFNLIV